MAYLVQGVLLGLSISLLLGPMIFLFIDASIEKGRQGSFMVGLGAWTSDLMYIVLSFFSFSFLLQLVESPDFKTNVGIIGGVILVVVGIVTLMQAGKRKRLERNKITGIPATNFKLWFKGFLINSLNPFCAIFWLGATSSLMIAGASTVTDLGLFATGSLGVIIIMDLVKIVLAERLLKVMSSKYQVILKNVAGAGIVLLGMVLIIRVI